MPKSFNDYVNEVRTNVKEISIEKLTQIYAETLFVIDIREEYECRGGMIPGSINISRGVLESSIENAFAMSRNKKDADIYLICRSGKRSVLAAQSLQNMGFKNVYSIQGGIKAWIDKRLKII